MDNWEKIKHLFQMYINDIQLEKKELDIKWDLFNEYGGYSLNHVFKNTQTYLQKERFSYNEVNYYYSVIKSRIFNVKEICDYDLFKKTQYIIVPNLIKELDSIAQYTYFITQFVHEVVYNEDEYEDNRNRAAKLLQLLPDLSFHLLKIQRSLPKYFLCFDDIYNEFPTYLKD